MKNQIHCTQCTVHFEYGLSKGNLSLRTQRADKLRILDSSHNEMVRKSGAAKYRNRSRLRSAWEPRT